MDGGALIASLVALALANRLLLDDAATRSALSAPSATATAVKTPGVAAASASTPGADAATTAPLHAAETLAFAAPPSAVAASAPKPVLSAAAPVPLPQLSATTAPAPSSLHDLAVHGVLSALVVCVTAVAGWLAQQALAPLALLHSTAFLVLPLAAAATALTAFATTRWRAALRTAAWPLIAANAVAIVVLMPAATTPDLATALLRSFLAGAGFTLALLALDTLDQRLQPREAPAAFRGLPLSLLNAGLLALAAQGLAGFVA